MSDYDDDQSRIFINIPEEEKQVIMLFDSIFGNNLEGIERSLKAGANPNRYPKYQRLDQEEIEDVCRELKQKNSRISLYADDQEIDSKEAIDALPLKEAYSNDNTYSFKNLFNYDEMPPTIIELVLDKCDNASSTLIIELLLKYGYDPNQPIKSSADQVGYLEKREDYPLCLLLSKHFESLYYNQEKNKKIDSSIEKIITLLLRHGANPNLKSTSSCGTSDGYSTQEQDTLHTTLSYVDKIKCDHVILIAKTLLNYGADINAINDQITPFSLVLSRLEKNNINDIIKTLNFLVDNGADINIYLKDKKLKVNEIKKLVKFFTDCEINKENFWHITKNLNPSILSESLNPEDSTQLNTVEYIGEDTSDVEKLERLREASAYLLNRYSRESFKYYPKTLLRRIQFVAISLKLKKRNCFKKELLWLMVANMAHLY